MEFLIIKCLFVLIGIIPIAKNMNKNIKFNFPEDHIQEDDGMIEVGKIIKQSIFEETGKGKKK